MSWLQQTLCSFDDVVRTCGQFLARHPGECIVMSVKDEWPARECTRTFAATFEWYVARRADVRWHLAAELPLLQTVRGGIVLLRRFTSAKPLGMDLTAWHDNATFAIDNGPFTIQAEFRVPVPTSIASKWRALDSLLVLASGLSANVGLSTFAAAREWRHRRSSWRLAIHSIEVFTSSLPGDSRLVRNRAAP